MTQPAALTPRTGGAPRPTLSAVPTGHRHLRVVDPTGTKDAPLVGYLVFAPEGTPPADLFSPAVTVRRVDSHRPPAALPQSAGLPAAAPQGSPETPAAPPAGTPAAGTVTVAGGVRVDHERHVAEVDGRELDLTYLEFELLAHLVGHPHLVHTRAQLVGAVWGYDYPGDGRTVDVHVARLRRKLGAARRNTIITVRRVGYKYVPEHV